MKRIIFLAALLISMSAASQPIQDDPAFRIGRLSNGLTYYLYHNESPASCADFYIAHNVGALQEEDSQNGLAHFLEHMAFNGTKHYPDKGLLEFLAKDGVRFGYNVNAYTSRTETVYNISAVPLVRESFVDSVLMVLHDWSCDISCEQDALDAERGVISEEWRLRDEPRSRMSRRQTELVYKGGKHPERTVLGTLEVINGFKREDILDFYHKWYRPDLQAIIIVGDFDVDAMEARVKAKFSDISMPVNPEPKPQSYMPPAQDGPLYADMTDPAIRYQALKLIYKQPYPSRDQRATEQYWRDRYCRLIINSILSDRMREDTKPKDCAVQSCVAVTNPESSDFYTTLLTLTPRRKTELDKVLEFAVSHVNRLLRYGISREEFEMARFSVSQRLRLETEVDPDAQKTSDIVKVCVENFLRGMPCVTPSRLTEVQRAVMAAISYEEASSYIAKMFRDSEVIYSNCISESEKDLAPSELRMREIVESTFSKDPGEKYLEYPDMDMSLECAPGRIVSSKAVKGRDFELLTLSNGVKVYYRRLKPVKNSVHTAMEMYFDGGYSLLPQDRIAASKYALSYAKRYAGVRGAQSQTLRSYPELAGISSLISFGSKESAMRLSAPRNKSEEMFKLAYLQVMEPYFGTVEAYETERARVLKDFGKERKSRDVYKEDIEDFVNGANPWAVRVDSAAVQTADFAFMEEVYKRSFGSVSGLCVFIASDEDEAQIKALVEKYIASLESVHPVRKAPAHPVVQSYKGNAEFYRTAAAVSAPLADIDCRFSAKISHTTRNLLALDVLDYIMSARYLALIREERGGAYHVDFSTMVYADPKRPVESYVDFQTRPELRDQLVKDVDTELARMAKDGPGAEEMELALKYFVKHHAEVEARNANSVGARLSEMTDCVKHGIDFGYDYTAAISEVSPSLVRKLAARLYHSDRLTAVYSEE